MNDAIVLAGGLGTRLRSVVSHVPKPLAPIQGVAFLDRLLDWMEESRTIKKIVLAIGYQSDVVVEHFAKHPRKIPISFSVEDHPLGTGGAVKHAMDQTETSSVFVLNGDSFLSCSLQEMVNGYRSPITMAYTSVPDASRFGRLELSQDERVTAFREKESVSRPGRVNGGIYLMDRTIFDRPLPEVFSLEKDLFPLLLAEGIFGFRTEGVFIDIGTPESYALAQNIFKK